MIAIAQIRGHLLSVVMHGIAHIHPIAAAAAQQQPLQQGGSFARWALSAIIPVRLGILKQSLLVGLVLRPRDVSHVRTRDQTDPLVRCYEFYGGVAIGQPTPFASSPHEGSRIPRVVDDLQHALVIEGFPDQFALLWTLTHASRKEQFVLPKRFHCRRGRSRPVKGRKQEGERLLHLLVGIQLHPLLSVVHQARRQRHLQLTAQGFAEDAAMQACLHDVNFCFRHLTLQARAKVCR